MAEASKAVDFIKQDARRGHISLVVGRTAEAYFADIGPELRLWAHTSVHLGPDQAHELGLALLAWAERKRA